MFNREVVKYTEKRMKKGEGYNYVHKNMYKKQEDISATTKELYDTNNTHA